MLSAADVVARRREGLHSRRRDGVSEEAEGPADLTQRRRSEPPAGAGVKLGLGILLEGGIRGVSAYRLRKRL